MVRRGFNDWSQLFEKFEDFKSRLPYMNKNLVASLIDRLGHVDHLLAHGVAPHLHHPEAAVAVELG